MTRIHNFSAGPGALPPEVLEEAKQSIWNHDSSGLGIMECSHRTPLFNKVIESAKESLTRLLHLTPDQKIVFMHGGARTQFFMLPMNLLKGGRATYIDTGTWSHGAIHQAKRYGTPDVPFSSRETNYDHVPLQGSLGELPEHTRYVHYTSNNTVAGTEFHYIPETGGVPLACDMSSDILSRPMDGSKFHLIYAGAQKNMGPAGVTLAIMKQEWLDECETDLPEMLRYDIHASKNSMYNTPCTFGIYMIERVAKWVERHGGVEAMDARNQAQCDALYGAIDKSDFYRGLAVPHSRSRMNVTFTTGSEALDQTFAEQAANHGMSGVKGHRSVGGLRASIYNAQTDEAVKALVDFMQDFEAKNG